MTPNLTFVRLGLVAGAVLVFLGGMLVAVGRWNRAETDRAFVEAAARAARAPAAAANGVRYWAPASAGVPNVVLRTRIEARERLRQPPVVPPLPTLPRLPLPQHGSALPGDKPPAVPQ